MVDLSPNRQKAAVDPFAPTSVVTETPERGDGSPMNPSGNYRRGTFDAARAKQLKERLSPLIGQEQASGVNPYIRMMVETPQLTAPTSEGEERSFSERWQLNLRAGQSETIGGAVQSLVFQPREDVDLDNPGDVADHLRGLRIRDMEESWNAMRPARTPA